MGHLGSPVKLLVALGHIVQFKPYFYRSGYQPAYNLLYNLYLVNCHNCRLFCFQRCFGSYSGQRLGHKCKILRDSSGHLSRDVVKTGHSDMRTGNIHQTKVEIGTFCVLPSGNLTYLYTCIENCPFIFDLPNLKMVIFHSLVSLPEGTSFYQYLQFIHIMCAITHLYHIFISLSCSHQ
jgi:hypothetical protein